MKWILAFFLLMNFSCVFGQEYSIHFGTDTNTTKELTSEYIRNNNQLFIKNNSDSMEIVSFDMTCTGLIGVNMFSRMNADTISLKRRNIMLQARKTIFYNVRLKDRFDVLLPEPKSLIVIRKLN